MPMGCRAAILSLALSASALAQDQTVRSPHGLLDANPQDRSQELILGIGFPWLYGVGVGIGAKYSIPIVKNGFIPKLNNYFSVEFGGDFGYLVQPGYSWYFIGVGADVRWSFVIVPRFTAYAFLGFGLAYVVSTYAYCSPYVSGYYCNEFLPQPDGGVGIQYRVADKLELGAEIGVRGADIDLVIDF
jgi:hypothetical protein